MNNFLEQRPIGRTGLMSSRLGIGSTFDAPASAIEDAFDRGINYLYWGTVRQPEFARAMRNLEKQHRDELILTIQSYSRDPGTIEAEIAECIKTAGVGEFDFLLLGSRDDVPEDAYVEVFERMRDKGMVRFLSLSSHNRPMLPTLLAAYENDTSPYDLLMLRYNAVHRGAEQDVFPFVAPAKHPAILTYTATRWAHLLDPEKMPPGEAPVSARDCFRYSLSHDAIDMVLCGPANAEQLNDAIAALERGPLEPDERERIERIGAYLYGEYAPAYPDKGDANDVTAGVAAQ
jgi:aryl-alcohol dehydrogenase-like predicted oxidoreductase